MRKFVFWFIILVPTAGLTLFVAGKVSERITVENVKANHKNVASPNIRIHVVDGEGNPISGVSVRRKVTLHYGLSKIKNFGNESVITGPSGTASFEKVTIDELMKGPPKQDYTYIRGYMESHYENSAKAIIEFRTPKGLKIDFSTPMFSVREPMHSVGKSAPFGSFTHQETGQPFAVVSLKDSDDVTIPLTNRVDDFECTVQLKERI